MNTLKKFGTCGDILQVANVDGEALSGLLIREKAGAVAL